MLRFASEASPRGLLFDNYLFMHLTPNQAERSLRIKTTTGMCSACISSHRCAQNAPLIQNLIQSHHQRLKAGINSLISQVTCLKARWQVAVPWVYSDWVNSNARRYLLTPLVLFVSYFPPLLSTVPPYPFSHFCRYSFIYHFSPCLRLSG